MTKKCLHEEWHGSLDDAISAEARVQAICMDTQDFARGYRAFLEKRTPVFEGN
jgi:enoyl-CoA hydratase/carnithine racemase